MEEQLIEYVRCKKFLYDPSHKDYRTQIMKKEAWDEIGENLGISGNYCKTMWCKLRNAYTQALKRTTKSGQAAKNLGKWKFEEQMAFVAPTLEPRSTQGNLRESEDDLLEAAISGTHNTINEHSSTSLPAPHSSLENVTEHREHDFLEPAATQNFEKDIANESEEQVPTSQKPAPKQTFERRANKRRLENSVSEVVSIMKDNSRIRSQLLLQNTNTKSSSPDHDDLEMFFFEYGQKCQKVTKRGAGKGQNAGEPDSFPS